MIDISARGVHIHYYWPDFLRRYQEMQAIANALNIGLEAVLDVYEMIHREVHVLTAENEGLNRYEKQPNISILVPDDATVEDRRVAILAKLYTRVPYTKRILKRFLDNLLGADGYVWNIDYANYTIWIRVDLKRKNQLNAVREMFRAVLPANMVIDLDLRYNQLYMLTKFTIEELKQYTVLNLKENPDIKRIYLERGGKLM